MAKQITLLRIFVASPEDIKEEKDSITKIVNELNSVFEKESIQLKVVKWETDVAPGMGEDQQDVINNDIGNDYDIFVGIMWKRFGTPTKRANSGTEEEFNRAYEKYQDNPDSIQIMFYFNQKQPNLDEIDTKQLDLLRKFKSKLGDEGALYCNYNGIDNFEPRFRRHLTIKVQSWGVKWGTGAGKVETIDETKEIDLFDEEDEYGFIDLIENGTDNFETSTDALNRISSAIETVGKKVRDRGEEFQESQTPAPNMNQGKKILKRIADDMEQFVKRVEPEIPIFSDAFSKGINEYTRAAALINDFQGENKDEILNALNAIRGMRTSMIPALGGMQNLRDAVYNIPRISRDINIAKKRMVTIIDNLIEEINLAKDLTVEAENTLETVLINSQKQNNLDTNSKQLNSGQ